MGDNNKSRQKCPRWTSFAASPVHMKTYWESVSYCKDPTFDYEKFKPRTSRTIIIGNLAGTHFTFPIPENVWSPDKRIFDKYSHACDDDEEVVRVKFDIPSADNKIATRCESCHDLDYCQCLQENYMYRDTFNPTLRTILLDISSQ